ncbi:MAG: hypothetical protein H7X88_03835 [Gloeobacteraceae cyanobacterium ES-bin-316]|nr:hypothetical protein [Ferruginibacter sp.]
MKKRLLLFLIMFATINVFAQTDSFDVFTYQPPEFFTKSELQSEVYFNMTNKDGSFCTITLCKRQPAKKDVLKDVIGQWNEQVVKRLPKANKKPARIMTEQFWDGWVSTLAVGNFYQNKKKCVVLLYSFRKNQTSACAVFAFSDKIFKGPVEDFSKNLHLINQQ